MDTFTVNDLKKLHIPDQDSHKGQNGRLLIIGGSQLFHSASLWSLTVASRIVDLVHYSSVPDNNDMVQKAKEVFHNGIVVPRGEVEEYIDEDDVILIGPGMTRDSETEELTNRLLKKHNTKQWVIDAGALQMMDVNLIPKGAILTPHHGEFRRFVNENFDAPSVSLANQHNDQSKGQRHSQSEVAQNSVDSPSFEEQSLQVATFAKNHQCIVLLKGKEDIVSDGKNTYSISGGNPGMTKGGTGDVLAGLIAALATHNDSLLATCAGSLINKTAGDDLHETVGVYFNASDLADQIPKTMKRLLL